MLCRVADDLFWMSRYVERAIAVGRIIDVTSHLELDAGDDTASFWVPLLAYAAPPDGEETLAPADIRRYLSVDDANPDSLVSCVRRAREAAQRVRESISTEMWEQINTLYLSLDRIRRDRPDANAYAFYRSVREGPHLVL